MVNFQELLGKEADSSNCKAFLVNDPFNKPNTLQGFICTICDYRYGALVITEVNGEEISPPQIIFATPKLHYPFVTDKETGERRYTNWPKNSEKYEIYKKLDGTNIFNYSYRDSFGNTYSTFKTRLTPVIREEGSTFGNFFLLWSKILEKYPQLRDVEEVLTGKVGISYELYGALNCILISYSVPLEAKLLFFVEQKDAGILPASSFRTVLGAYSGPILEVREEGVGEEVEKRYLEERERMASENAQILTSTGEYLDANEGTVFYVLENSKWRMYKCKPQDIEAIHFAAGQGIETNAIYTTVINALENYTIEQISRDKSLIYTLLEEEFTSEQITKAKIKIEKVIEKVVEEVKRQEEITAILTSFIPTTTTKNELMRYLAIHIQDKSKMKKVFQQTKKLYEANLLHFVVEEFERERKK